MEVFFNTLELNNKNIKDCEIAYKGKHDNVRLYID